MLSLFFCLNLPVVLSLCQSTSVCLSVFSVFVSGTILTLSRLPDHKLITSVYQDEQASVKPRGSLSMRALYHGACIFQSERTLQSQIHMHNESRTEGISIMSSLPLKPMSIFSPFPLLSVALSFLFVVVSICGLRKEFDKESLEGKNKEISKQTQDRFLFCFCSLFVFQVVILCF